MEHQSGLLASIDEVVKAEPDVVIIGSGPAGVAVAEHLYEEDSELKVAVIERGSILALTHFNNLFTLDKRGPFIDRFCEHPWEGDMRAGMLLPAIGGRGIAAGAHLRRFDSIDFNLWPDGVWPRVVVAALEKWYPVAEARRRVYKGDPPGSAQNWAKERLSGFSPGFPPLGVDFTDSGRFHIGRGFDSSAVRLWHLLLRDHLEGAPRRLWVVPNTHAIRFTWDDSLIGTLECIHESFENLRTAIAARAFVLAASPIESARIILNSGLDRDVPAAGRYLADHVWCRAKMIVEARSSDNDGINLIIAPQGNDRGDRSSRFQVHLRGEKNDGVMVVDVGGFAAMDPSHGNAVALSGTRDRFNVPKAQTRLQPSPDDNCRVDRMCDRILELAELLNAEKFITDQFPQDAFKPQYVKGNRIHKMPLGQSYHEAGTLRMGENLSTSATDSRGKFHSMDNLFIADASLFPSVGIANPMLTVTALGYHVADFLVRTLNMRQVSISV